VGAQLAQLAAYLDRLSEQEGGHGAALKVRLWEPEQGMGF
jgi:hypothetical protein